MISSMQSSHSTYYTLSDENGNIFTEATARLTVHRFRTMIIANRKKSPKQSVKCNNLTLHVTEKSAAKQQSSHEILLK